MLRRFDFLVTEVREATDMLDINSLGVYEILRYFNDGQKLIQKIIFTANSSTDIFTKHKVYTVLNGISTYDLPFDIYAHNSVTNLSTFDKNTVGQELKRVAFSEKSRIRGYALLDKTFILSTALSYPELLLNYVYQLPIMSYRLGQISAVDPNTGVVSVDGASIIDNTDFTDRYENFSIVDSRGNQVANELFLNSFLGLTFNFDGTLGPDTEKELRGAEIGDWIVCGKSGTSHSFLPDECESFLMTYVQRRMLARSASSEITTENIFTNEERRDLEDLFKDTVIDALYPVTSDSDYLRI